MIKLRLPEDQVKKALDDEIMNLFEHLNGKDEFDEESEKVVNAVAKLYELRQKERLSMDTVVTVLTNLAGIVAILQHERVHVVASKAFGLIKKIV